MLSFNKIRTLPPATYVTVMPRVARVMGSAPHPSKERGGSATIDRAPVNINMSFDSFYRVILHFTNWPADTEVARSLCAAVPLVNMNASKRIVQNARAYGRAIVVTVTQADAELFKARLKQRNLMASLEEA
jgi:hypothetical protein